MLNAIPAMNLLGTSNPLSEQSNLVQIPHAIRTHNNERLSARSIEDIKKNAKSRSLRKDQQDDEEESDEGEEPFPQQQHHPSMQERLQMAKQGKVSINQRAVSALFLQQSQSGRGLKGGSYPVTTHPSIDVVA